MGRLVGGGVPLVLLALLGAGEASAQRALPPPSVFPVLLADPKRPQFSATYLRMRSTELAPRLSTVALGGEFGLARSRDGAWEASVEAAVFSQFDMRARSNDLINTDYVAGVAVGHRRGTVSGKLRIYHQSSHLGDEFILHTDTERLDLTYEALELLLSKELQDWRVYGGGEYLFQREPADLRPGVLHGGFEYRAPEPLLNLGALGRGRVVAGLDARSFQDRAWSAGWSLKTGMEFSTAAVQPVRLGWRLLLQAYDGPAPYGQFYRDRVSFVGLGLELRL